MNNASHLHNNNQFVSLSYLNGTTENLIKILKQIIELKITNRCVLTMYLLFNNIRDKRPLL